MTLGQGIDLASVADRVLAAVVDHYAAAEVALPARQVIAAGNARDIAWDAAQLVVTVGSLSPGQGPGVGGGVTRAGAHLRSSLLWHATVYVQIVRCVTEPDDPTRPPSAAVMRTEALAVFRDVGLLAQALSETASSLQRGTAPSTLVSPGPVETLGPSGGLAGCEGSISFTAASMA